MKAAALLLLLSTQLCAEVLDASYTISYWFLDNIATTTLHYEAKNGRYRIEADAALQGFAASLGHHHREHHISEGIITSEGRLEPRRYETRKVLDGYHRVQRFRFDHRRRRITLRQTTTYETTERHFDLQRMRFDSRRAPITRYAGAVLNFYARNDLLTLYFNARERLGALRPDEHLRLPAVGSRNGIVRILPARNGSTEEKSFWVHIDQDIFRSRDGMLRIVMDQDLYIEKAMLKDVFLFGDLRVERTKLIEK